MQKNSSFPNKKAPWILSTRQKIDKLKEAMTKKAYTFPIIFR
ncbi:hypothetical protein D920_00537 [Enterococcus faecalis 13-SD-W-01]|nr:hypothetical protein D920_00537 [Enterococcus faecalis 13-SD-W-01]